MNDALSATELGISEHALALYRASDVIDLHLDTFIWRRLFGYDLHKRHGLGPLGGRLCGQADIPRVCEAGMTGAYWIITTQPLRGAAGRSRALKRNVTRLRGELGAHPKVTLVATHAEYVAARACGQHAAFIGIQGGNALATPDDVVHASAQGVSLVTLLHFTRSPLGAPQLPPSMSREPLGLGEHARVMIDALDRARVIVDVSHLHARGFWEVARMQGRKLPFVASHAASHAVRPHFRNLDDDQLRAVADSGGVIGIVFNAGFLTHSWLTAHVSDLVAHVLHMVKVVGDQHVCLGSDFDGAIIPPRDLRSVLELPRLVDALLRAGLAEQSVQRILGENFLRVLAAVRP